MTFKIDLYDVYEGYVEANSTCPLDRKDVQTDSTWTYFVINHFAQLGRLLGFEIELEKQYSHGRNDLVWYKIGKENKREIFLHLESENGRNLIKSLEKLKDTPAEVAILLTYSSSRDSLQSLKEDIILEIKQWRIDLDVLAIISPVVNLDEDDYFQMIGIIPKKKKSFNFKD